MKTKISKKTVDSIRKRKTRQGFVLNIGKIKKSTSLIKKPEKLFTAQSRVMKITAAILIISLNWLGISAIGKTFALFTDTALVSDITFNAGTLDFSLTSPTDDFVPQNECDESEDEENDNSMHNNNNHNDRPNDCEEDSDHDNDNDQDNNGNGNQSNNNEDGHEAVQVVQTTFNRGGGTENTGSAIRKIQIKKETGSMSFQYVPSIKNVSGDQDFCDSLTLQAKLAGETEYFGDIANFNFGNKTFVINENSADVWNFTISFHANGGEGDKKNGENHNHNSDNSSSNKLCRFNFSFRAWQVDLSPEYGFGTEKVISNSIESNLENNFDDDGSDAGENDNQGKIKTSLTSDGGDNGNGGVQESENSDVSSDILEENSIEIGENTASENIPVLNENKDEVLPDTETPIVNPASENSDNSDGGKPINKNDKKPKDQGQAEDAPMLVP